MTLRVIAGILGGEFFLFLLAMMCTDGDMEDTGGLMLIIHALAAFVGIVTLAAYAVEFALTGSWGNW